jgi:hypothetical protein
VIGLRIVVDVNTAGQVHFFKHAIVELRGRGHEVLITGSRKNVSIDLLEIYGLGYTYIGNYGTSMLSKALNLPLTDWKMFDSIKRFSPDLILGFGSIRAAHVSRMLRTHSLSFDDTEHSREQHALYIPFTDVICTPACFRKDFGKKHIRFNGYKELAYLHPNYYKPDASVLDDAGISNGDRFAVMRLISWDASHDLGQHGIKDPVRLVKELERYMPVLITSEGKLDKGLEKNRITLSPEKLHDLLYYASLYIGEGGTTAAEAAILGTPSIYVSSLEGSMGNFLELEQKYRLMYSYRQADSALDKVKEMIQEPKIMGEWASRREKLLNDKIDVTRFMVWFIENYPESAGIMKADPGFQERFR